MNLALWLERTAATGGDRPALFRGAEMVADYAVFHAAAAAVAGALHARGVRPGGRVALFMKNCPDYLVALYGVWIAGAAVVPINAKLHPREAAWIIADAGADLAFVTPELGPGLAATTAVPLIDVTAPAFAAMRAHGPCPVQPRDAGDLAWLFYTSGTTGRPKGVVDHPRDADGHGAVLLPRCRPGPPRRRRALCRAAEPWCGTVQHHACARGRTPRGPGLGRVRARRDLRPRPHPPRHPHVRRADHGEADDPGRQGDGRARRGSAQHHLCRRTDVPCRHHRGGRAFRPDLHPGLRPGRVPDVDFGPDPRGCRRPRRTRAGARDSLRSGGRSRRSRFGSARQTARRWRSASTARSWCAAPR